MNIVVSCSSASVVIITKETIHTGNPVNIPLYKTSTVKLKILH